MKKIKSANNQLFDQILSVNKQKENEFNNGQDGAIILSLLMMFFIPFLLLNTARHFLSIDYSFGAAAGMLALSGLVTVILYKKFNISSRFAEKGPVLNQLLSRYTPKNKSEYQKLQEERQVDPQNFFTLVNDWVEVERQYYSK
ncbi:hypothetical protein [Providencia heimbachae]|uniref:Uncharacterized protein n=1 Tax=Providencia heimbachae ATCC 35613 TaxID=1354272 RepID=A0A1B7JTN6_9GAMM|nr:hypothetical protein [Providencia heimbachae]OAT51261.1 hypothetical protein M998_2197 [Providencia heimbachae ATCC 35613]SQH11422.1 Uncharacterised protein [Providencia heimbachae]